MPRSYILSGEHDFLGENGPETRSEKEASQRRGQWVQDSGLRADGRKIPRLHVPRLVGSLRGKRG